MLSRLMRMTFPRGDYEV